MTRGCWRFSWLDAGVKALVITMGGNDRRRQELERDELVNVLRTGSLPAPLREASVRELP
jgi:hypothetical protein